MNHFAAIYSIPLFYQYLVAKNDLNLTTWKTVFYFFESFIIILMSFVYNEIIILRFFGLDESDNNNQIVEGSGKDSLISSAKDDTSEFVINGLDSN